MIRFLSAALVAMSASTANADVDFGSYDQFQTRFGMASVVGAIPSQGLVVSGATLPVELDYMWEILGAWGLAETDHDWLLATHHHGGNGCGAGVTVVRVGAGEVRMMGETAGCEGAVSDLRVLPSALELDVFTDGLRRDFTTYRFEVSGVTQTPGRAPTPVASGTTADPTRWVGQHVSHLLRDPGEQARLLSIMTEEDLTALYAHISVGGPVERRGDWVLAAGCMPHSCDRHGAALGIRISDGQVRAVYWEPASDGWTDSTVLGVDDVDFTWLDWLNEHRDGGM